MFVQIYNSRSVFTFDEDFLKFKSDCGPRSANRHNANVLKETKRHRKIVHWRRWYDIVIYKNYKLKASTSSRYLRYNTLNTSTRGNSHHDSTLLHLQVSTHMYAITQTK